MPIQISQATQNQISNVERNANALQQELNRLSQNPRERNLSNAEYQYLGNIGSSIALLALACKNLLQDLQRVP